MASSMQWLSTGEIDSDIMVLAQESGIALQVIPFIQTRHLNNEDVISQIAAISGKQARVIFTSSRAIEAISGMTLDCSKWQVWCVGSSTADLVSHLMPNCRVLGMADDASSLAELIKQSTHDDLYFICGISRLPVLPDRLNEAGLRLFELPVYETVPTPITLSQFFDAVFFFSPSMVKSFFSVNVLASPTVIFAIGHTTASEASKHCPNIIEVAPRPSKKALFEYAIRYFTHKNRIH